MENRMLRFTALAGIVLLCPSGLRGQDEVQKIIDKAVKAHGGEANLAKFKAYHLHFKGTRDIQGNDVPFTQEVFFQFPDKLKETTKIEFMGQERVSSMIVNGDEVSFTARGQDKPVSESFKKEMQEALHAARLRIGLALNDKELKFAPLGEVQVNGKPAVGLKVSAKDRRDVNLFFDKESGLLVKSERQFLQGDKEAREERIVEEFQEVQGVKIAKKTQLLRDGQKVLVTEVTQAKLLEKLDDAVFKR